MIDLQMDIEEAKKGRQLWLEIKRVYSFIAVNDCLFVFSSGERDLNHLALEEIPNYMRRKYLKRAIILGCEDMLTENNGELVEKERIICLQLKEEQIRQILKYYRLIQFTKNILVVSLEEPYGNKNMIDRGGITLADYVKNAIFV